MVFAISVFSRKNGIMNANSLEVVAFKVGFFSKEYWVLCGYLFIAMYGPRLFGFFDTSTFIALIACVLFLMKNRELPISFIVPVSVLFLLVAYSIALALIVGTQEVYYPLRFLRCMFAFMGAWVVAEWVVHKVGVDKAVVMLLSSIVTLTLIHAVVIMAMFYSLELKEFIYVNWSNYPVERARSLSRVFGLVPNGPMNSYIQVIGIYTLIALALLREKGVSLVQIMLLFISSFLIAQTGIVFLILSFPIVMYTLYFYKRLSLAKLLGYLLLPVFLLSMVFSYFNSSFISETSKKVIERNLEVVLSVFYKDELQSQSVSILLKDHLKFPDDAETFLFGSSFGPHTGGDDEVEKYRTDSDIGYITNLFGVGVLGSLLIIFFYFFTAYVVFQNKRIIGFPLTLIFFIFLGFLLIGNAKEPDLMGRIGIDLYAMLYAVACLIIENKKKVKV